MSTHTAEVFRIQNIEPHPDPETINLGIVRVHDYQVVVNKHQWKVGDLAIYIFPDSVCPLDFEAFAFLKKEGQTKTKERIKVKRLRGVWSEGLLIPALEGLKEGDNAWDVLGLERYEPGMIETGLSARWEKTPERAQLPFSKYDLEDFRKWHHIFRDGEQVMISEKIHGCVSFDTIVDTLEYGPMLIGEIIEKKLHVHVKSFDHTSGEISYCKVLDWSKMSNNNDWYEIETEDGQVLKVTGDHMVFEAEINAYREVSNLKVGDVFLID